MWESPLSQLNNLGERCLDAKNLKTMRKTLGVQARLIRSGLDDFQTRQLMIEDDRSTKSQSLTWFLECSLLSLSNFETINWHNIQKIGDILDTLWSRVFSDLIFTWNSLAHESCDAYIK